MAEKPWEVEIDGKLYEADSPTLEKWIKKGRVVAFHRVRRGGLQWIEISRVPAFGKFFNTGINKPRRPNPNDFPRRPWHDSEGQHNSLRARAPLTKKASSRAVQLIVLTFISGVIAFSWVLFSKHPDIYPDKVPNFVSRKNAPEMNITLTGRLKQVEESIHEIDFPKPERYPVDEIKSRCTHLADDAVKVRNMPLQPGNPEAVINDESGYAWKKYEDCLAKGREFAEQRKRGKEIHRQNLDKERTELLRLIEEERNERVVKYNAASNFTWAFMISFAVLVVVGFFNNAIGSSAD